jgi:hypothetical protein
MSMIRDHRLYFAYTCDYKAIALCCIYEINQHSYYYGKQWTHFSILCCCFLPVLCDNSSYGEEENQDYPDS